MYLILYILYQRREISFSIAFKHDGRMCNAIDTFSEEVEFSLRFLSEPEKWIPIRFMYSSIARNTSSIYIGEPGELFRGYKVEQSTASDGWNKLDIQICSFSLNDSLQFRWLQTSVFTPGGIKDVWFMDNITINLVLPSSNCILLVDDFNNENLK